MLRMLVLPAMALNGNRAFLKEGGLLFGGGGGYWKKYKSFYEVKVSLYF